MQRDTKLHHNQTPSITFVHKSEQRRQSCCVLVGKSREKQRWLRCGIKRLRFTRAEVDHGEKGSRLIDSPDEFSCAIGTPYVILDLFFQFFSD